ncbi:MAG: hypothetical protein MI919_40585 [Holophagales bacterium]|nr:hypothetical protein [Holophagales bacterium]
MSDARGPSGRRARGLAACAFVAGAALAAVPLAAERPDTSFRRGVQAVDRDRWALAEKEMRRAIQLDGRESRRKISITGMRYEWYLPYYFLGLALLRQGDRNGAREAWQESRSQGVILGWRDAATFSEQWNGLFADSGPPPPRRPPPPVLSPRERLATAVSSLEGLVRIVGPPTTPLVEALLRAAEVLGEARRAETANRVDPSVLAGLVPRVEAVEAQLRAASKTRGRRSEEVARDLRALVDRMRAEAPADAGIEETLLDAEIELGRNAPDVAALKRHEAALLRAFHPILAPGD